MKDETRRWVEIAESDLDVASALLDSDHCPHCVFFCQQAVEMLLKSMWIEQADEGLPHRTHDLVSLGQDLGLSLSDEHLEFLRRLSEQYIPTRYAEVSVEYQREDAVEYLEKTRELFSWLRHQLS